MSTISEIRNNISYIEGLLRPAEEEFLYATAQGADDSGVIVEIGSRKGRSTVFLAMGSRAGRGVLVYAVDPHFGTYMHRGFSDVGLDPDTYEEFLNNLDKAGVKKNVLPIRQTSEKAVLRWNEPIAVLFIDGDHTYAGVKKDYDLWSPYVIEGGVIAFHDSTYGDVKRFLLREVLKSGNYSYVGLVDSILYLNKSVNRNKIFFWYKYLIVFSLLDVGRKVKLPPLIRERVKVVVKKILK